MERKHFILHFTLGNAF